MLDGGPDRDKSMWGIGKGWPLYAQEAPAYSRRYQKWLSSVRNIQANLGRLGADAKEV